MTKGTTAGATGAATSHDEIERITAGDAPLADAARAGPPG
jgi:hypothetical protein